MATNAVVPETLEDGGGDTGLDDPVVTLSQSQGTNEYEENEVGSPLQVPPGADDETPAPTEEGEEPILLGGGDEVVTTGGAGATEDSGEPSAAAQSSTQATTPGNTGRITPQPNVLDRFATYNYQASVYLMSPTQFDEYTKRGKKNINAYNLLFQTGGAPNNVGGPTGGQGSAASGRNPFFPNDFYIDSITLENRLFGKSTSAAHSVAEMKFTVIEPANISLIDCLYSAVQDMQPRGADGAVNYAAAVYLMVIRFYGQDLNGNFVKVGAADPKTGLTDANAVIEKFIPFKIKEIQFSVSNKLATYEFVTAPIGQIVANGTRRGTIPSDIEVSGMTVGAVLSGDLVYGTVESPAAAPGAATTTDSRNVGAANDPRRLDRPAQPAPPKANNAPNNKKYIKQGLIAAMNEFQQQLVKDKVYEKADIYEIVFVDGAEKIRDAATAKPDKKVNKSATPMAQAPTQNPSQSSPDKNNMDTTARNLSIAAGMQLVQTIDQIIRTSSYITDQALTVIDEETGLPVPNPQKTTSGFSWFNIMMQATQLEYDNLRNDFAYRITYYITPYTVTDINSPYFPLGRFQGVHKTYSWWFTGANTQVLDYQATFNKLYNLTVSGSSPNNTALVNQRKKFTSSMRDISYVTYQARSTESAQGAEGKSNELSANAAEYLYNPSDNANAKVRILGDPAWIQQGSLSGIVDPKTLGTAPFLPDGTINFDVNDIMFEVVWQRPEDYDLKTGLADPYGRTQKTFGDRNPVQSVVYRARTVTSEFKQGRFEQTLDGTLYNYPIPSGKNKAATAAQSGGNAAAVGASDEGRAGEAESAEALAQSAQNSTYGNNGARTEPESTQVVPGQDSGEEESPNNSQEPDQSAAAAPPPEPVQSNGEVADVSTDTAEAVLAAGTVTEPQVMARDW